MLQQSMTREWGPVAGACWGPWGICICESPLLSGAVWFPCFKILLWALSEEITPFGPKGQLMWPIGRSGMIKL